MENQISIRDGEIKELKGLKKNLKTEITSLKNSLLRTNELASQAPMKVMKAMKAMKAVKAMKAK